LLLPKKQWGAFQEIKCMVLSLVVILTFPVILSGCDIGSHNHSYQGYVEGINTYLAAPYSGTLLQSFVERGQQVVKGQLLFQLDPKPESLQLRQTQALLFQAKQLYEDLKQPKRQPEIDVILAQINQVDVQQNLANIRVKRSETLYEKHAIDRDAVDAALEHARELDFLKAQYEAQLALARLGSRKHQIKAQEAQIRFLNAQLYLDQWKVSQKTIYAPMNGVIFDTYFRPGEYVDAAHAIASLLTPKEVQIVFFVNTKDVSMLSLGQRIAFDCEGCLPHQIAAINYISPEAEYVPPLIYSRENYDKLVFRVQASTDNSGALKPGQPVIVQVSEHG